MSSRLANRAKDRWPVRPNPEDLGDSGFAARKGRSVKLISDVAPIARSGR